MRTVFGDNHPGTLNTMNGLALTYKAQGKYDQAEALYKQGKHDEALGKP